MPLRLEDAITSPNDPAASELGRSSRFIGVSRIVRRNNIVRWRVSLSKFNKVFHVGDFENEMTAARVSDNARYYSAIEFEIPIPALNFPNTYKDKSVRPPIWIATSRVIRRLQNAEVESDRAKAEKILRGALKK